MSKLIESKVGSTVYARLNAVRMSEPERQRAIHALQTADLLVDAWVWVIKTIEQLRDRLVFAKPALKH